jgi:hypothetical protein
MRPKIEGQECGDDGNLAEVHFISPRLPSLNLEIMGQ